MYPRIPSKGGNRHPVALGGTIYRILSAGDTWGQNMYRQYKADVQAVPYTTRSGKLIKGRKRPVGSYNYFMHYLHVCESLGLIERVIMGKDRKGNSIYKTQPAVEHTAGSYDPTAPDITVPEFQQAQFWHLLVDDPARFKDPWGTKYPSSRRSKPKK